MLFAVGVGHVAASNECFADTGELRRRGGSTAATKRSARGWGSSDSMPSLASASESSDSDWESECVARDGESDSGSDRNRSARSHSPPPRHTASSRAAAKRMKDSAVYRGALADGQERCTKDGSAAASEAAADGSAGDGAVDYMYDGDVDDDTLARESPTSAAAAATPLRRETAAGGAGANGDTENVFSAAHEGAAESVQSEVADRNRLKRFPGSESLARESRTLTDATATPLGHVTAAGVAGAKRDTENGFPAAHEQAAGSVAAEVADGNRLGRIPASEVVARESPASAERAVTAFGGFEEEHDVMMTSEWGDANKRLVFAPVEATDAVVLDDRPTLEASSTTAEPRGGEAEDDHGSDADSRDGETEPKRRKMTIDERERWLARQSALSDALAAASVSARELRGGSANATAAPVARGRSDSPAASGTESLADRTAEEALRLPGGTYDMARLVAEDDAFVRLARMPRANVSDAAEPLPPPVLSWGERGAWRPRLLTDVYTGAGVKLIVGWYAEMAAYEQLGKMKGGSGLRRPDDVRLGDEFVQPAARGRPWFLLDHIRSGGKKPIIPLEEAGVTEEVLQGARIRSLGEDYHNKAVLDHLVEGHRNASECPRVTVLSANHAGALRNADEVGKTFADDSAASRGWLMGSVAEDTPLVVEIDGEEFTVPVFVATCPARVEPVNGVEQNGKVRVTTDKAWPRPDVLDDSLGPHAVNFWIDMGALAKVVFPTTVQFAAACAILMQAEPESTRRLTTARERAAAAAAAPEEHCWEWKIDLHSAYRQWSNARHELWMYGKQWAGQSYLDVRTQFGDASMVANFAEFTNFFLWLLRRLRSGDEKLREQLAAPKELWAAIDATPTAAAVAWREQREAAGLCDEDVELTFEAGYIDDMFGVALGYSRTKAMLELSVLLAEFIGFTVQDKKKAGPERSMAILGSRCDLNERQLSLDGEKADSYGQLLTAALGKRSLRTKDFLSLVCKLVHASQYRPSGRPYLTSSFTALRQAQRKGRGRVRMGRGVVRDLRYWARALRRHNDGVALFPKNRFPASGDPDLLEFAYDASGGDGLGAAMLVDDADGGRTCYYILHKWEGVHRRLHINLKEGVAGHTALTGFYPLAPRPTALAHGDNTTEQRTSETNKARSVLQSVVLQHRAEFVADVNVSCRQARVKSKDNVLSDAISRLDEAGFRKEARLLGVTRFVRVPLPVEAVRLMDDLAARLAQLEADGEDTSGTVGSVEEMRRQERLFERISADKEARKAKKAVEEGVPETTADVDFDSLSEWGFLSGFCGLDSLSFAAEPIGGVPVAAFDMDDIVRKLWRERTGMVAWGDFYHVVEAAQKGALDWLKPLILIYLSGSPCPDFSSAGHGRGLDGRTGGLWLDDCRLGILLGSPIIIREMVTGILDVDDGSPLWKAIAMYKSAGYSVNWSVRHAQRHGDGTARRRVFLVAIQPEALRDGVTEEDFFSVERTGGYLPVTVEMCLDTEPEDARLCYDALDHITWYGEKENDPSYDGPKLLGGIGRSGMGWSLHDANGPGITSKTWGQGPAGSTGLYWDGKRARRLSPWEALRTHSIPDHVISMLRESPLVDWEVAYRLCGNGIPVGMLSDVVKHVMSLISPQVRRSAAQAIATWKAAGRPRG